MAPFKAVFTLYKCSRNSEKTGYRNSHFSRRFLSVFIFFNEFGFLSGKTVKIMRSKPLLTDWPKNNTESGLQILNPARKRKAIDLRYYEAYLYVLEKNIVKRVSGSRNIPENGSKTKKSANQNRGLNFQNQNICLCSTNSKEA